MSQYPPPPPYPSPYPAPYADPAGLGYAGPGPVTTPAGRRAGVLLLVLGPLTILLGGCVGLLGFVLTAAPSTPDLDNLRRQVFPPGIAPRVVEVLLAVLGGIVVLIGATLATLGPFVRRGRRGATVAAVVLVGLVGLYLAANAVAALAKAGSNGVGAACFSVLTTAAFGVQMAWLINALRSGPAAGGGDPYQQYLAQWYQYQQAAQAYGTGAGYGVPVANPTSPTTTGDADGPAPQG